MSVFRSPQEVFAEIATANAAIRDIQAQINALASMRSYWTDLKDNARSELKAMTDPDGHLPGCPRTGVCLGEGWCQM